MRLAPAEAHHRVSEAVSRLQGDGGIFRRFVEGHKLDRVEFWLMKRFRHFPTSATPGDFATFGPYTSVSIYQDALEALAQKKEVERTGESRYRLAEPARKAIAGMYDEYFSYVARVNALPGEEAAALHEWVDRVYAAALRQSDVPVPILNAAHSVLPDSDSIWVHIERRLVGLLIYRDDSHIAAWREAGYTGPRIELSTALSQAEGGMAHDELRQATSRLDDKDFASALSALHSSGEVTRRAGRFRLSRTGRRVRQGIEAGTDRNYGRPFAALEEEQIEQMMQLLAKIARAER
ncbi:MAG TPA: hypothetical protein VFL17_17610 [Anaerolineae bacterium]|nr:hypothetical protein [Anaerolineae bacterium]